MTKLTHLDLFSGIGGFSLAGKWAGFETVAFCEKDDFCQKVLAKHWPHTTIHKDIKKLSYKSHVNLITGGFPCQPFSVAGKKKGKNDERYLWPEFLRIIQECKPNWIVAENVTGIVGVALDNIIDDLEEAGYETQSFIIPACAANAPHRRDRIWIVAHTMRERRNDGKHHWEERSIQENFERYMAEIQSKRSQFQPKPWTSYGAKQWFEANAASSRANYGLPHGLDRDRIKALGNAIVPQVVYPILAFINYFEKQ